MDRDFEKYLGGPTLPNSERLHVTLSPQKVVRMNYNTHRLLGKPEALYLHFSRSRDTIALEPAGARMPAAFPIRIDRGGLRVNAAPFCRHFNIRPDRTMKFNHPEISPDGKLLLLNLADTTFVDKGKRSAM